MSERGGPSVTYRPSPAPSRRDPGGLGQARLQLRARRRVAAPERPPDVRVGDDRVDVQVEARATEVVADALGGLGPRQLAAVLDLAERMHAAILRGDSDGRERVRQELGIAG